MIAMAMKSTAEPNAKRAARPVRSAQRSVEAAVSHPDRIVFPEDGITKRELAEYYIALAPALWPHLQARPLSVLRSVAAGRNFFQCHLDGALAAGFQPVEPGADSSAEWPELFTARRGAANRKGRMYIDWQRNQQGATTVAAYSPRWRKGAPVSTPVAWSELGKLDLRGARFNLRNAVARYRRIGDPWLQQPCRAQSLSAAVQRELERRTA